MSETRGEPARAVFLVECFAPARGEASGSVAERVNAACAGLRATGADIAYLGVLVVPDDELAFHLFLAADAGVVLVASRRAALRVERVVQAVAISFAGREAGDRRALPITVEQERAVAHEPGEIGP